MPSWLTYGIGIVALFTVGCTTTPLPRPIYRDMATIIAIQQDTKAGTGHNHPAQISPDLLQQVLGGIHIQSRKSFPGSSLITGGSQPTAAFSKEDLAICTPHLSQGLAKAQPSELVTFYRRISTSSVGLGITSGGLFVRGQHLYVILANARTLPSEGMREGLLSEIDPVENPLLPISRTSFRATFMPATSLVPEDERWAWPYIDQGRVVVIDLVQFMRDRRAHMPHSAP